MRILNNCLFIVLLNYFLLGLTNTVLADSRIEIDNDSHFTDKTLNSGPIKVSVTHTPLDLSRSDSSEDKNLFYQIYYNDKKQVEAKDYTQTA
ncbi:hypothetical protein VB715_02330 [Crocosphaera sp. UHCC 0190]|uniref:hypothetical protein n=1 Tax=Crocosphaera sp. UHCC 0190 TaxID=3110246 RepID=UPI002B1F9319|nr:hypothetical protein [Crocosphaera sp. UHCC 0190]MEA5508593.1 hypothetical protein [Crocosphaera sp. UHCC 0190]